MDLRKALAFAAIYLIWGSTYLGIRIAIETMPPFLMAGIRFGSAGLILYLFLRIRGVASGRPVHWASALVLGSAMLAGGNGLVTWAEQYVPSGIAAVMIATVPLWMVLLDAWPFRGSRLTPASVTGLIVGFLGVVVLVAPGQDGLSAIHRMGAIALIVAALSWSLGSLGARRLPVPKESLMTAAMQMICGGGVLLVWGLLAGEAAVFDVGAISMRSWIALIYLVTFGSILALGCYVWLMKVSTAASVSTYAFVNPLVAVVLGWLFAGESFGARAIGATALILLAVVFLQRAQARRTPPAEKPVERAEWRNSQPCRCEGESAA